MSSEKGNLSRSRAQKYKNTRAFKNNLHDKTPKIKLLNSLEITDVCPRCKDVLDWKIKYKKYKVLKNPSTCVKCLKKNVTNSYRMMCQDCAVKFKVCPKCGLNEEERKLEELMSKAKKPSVDGALKENSSPVKLSASNSSDSDDDTFD